MAGWTDDELAASVAAYRRMQKMDASGQAYTKTEVYRALAKDFGRSEGAFERRMQNISAVLDELGQPWIAGLAPLQNVGAGVKPKLVGLLTGTPLPAVPLRTKRTPQYKEKLSAIRAWLITVARAEGKVTYGDVMLAFDIDRFSLRHALGNIGHEAKNLGEPILTALVVGKRSGVCSQGLAKEFEVHDDGLERRRLYDFWGDHSNNAIGPSDGDQPPLNVRAARFASSAVRPEQAAFRRRVYTAWQGRCAITSCDVRQALDAAHRHGRDWKAGHNHASDGILLRKDLHALYDAKLLRISSAGEVELDAALTAHYGSYAAKKVKSVTDTSGAQADLRLPALAGD